VVAALHSSLLDVLERNLSSDERRPLLNALKMNVYLLCQFIERYESSATKPANTISVGAGKVQPSYPFIQKQSFLLLILLFTEKHASTLFPSISPSDSLTTPTQAFIPSPTLNHHPSILFDDLVPNP